MLKILLILLLSSCRAAPIEYYNLNKVVGNIKEEYLISGMDCKEFAAIAQEVLISKGYIVESEHVVFGRNKHH